MDASKVLPLGSVVILKEGLQKLVIIGRGTIYKDAKTGEEKVADYMAILYPMGFNLENTVFIDHKNIDKVLYEGYVDEEEERFLEIYNQWKKDLKLEKKKEQIAVDLVF